MTRCAGCRERSSRACLAFRDHYRSNDNCSEVDGWTNKSQPALWGITTAQLIAKVCFHVCVCDTGDIFLCFMYFIRFFCLSPESQQMSLVSVSVCEKSLDLSSIVIAIIVISSYSTLTWSLWWNTLLWRRCWRLSNHDTTCLHMLIKPLVDNLVKQLTYSTLDWWTDYGSH